jgi:RNA polymerase sigma-70 factor (ECF subfamily)
MRGNRAHEFGSAVALARQALTSEMAAGDGRAAPVTITPGRFEAWYAELRAPLRAYLRGLSGRAGEAEDLFQETWIRVLTHPPRTLDAAAVRAYLFTIATRLAIDAARREVWIGRWIRPMRARQDPEDTRGDALEAIEGHAPAPDAQHHARELVARAFRPLSPRDRVMIWLAHVERYDHVEIAAMLGMRPTSVRVLLHRARKRAFAAVREPTPIRGGKP